MDPTRQCSRSGERQPLSKVSQNSGCVVWDPWEPVPREEEPPIRQLRDDPKRVPNSDEELNILHVTGRHEDRDALPPFAVYVEDSVLGYALPLGMGEALQRLRRNVVGVGPVLKLHQPSAFDFVGPATVENRKWSILSFGGSSSPLRGLNMDFSSSLRFRFLELASSATNQLSLHNASVHSSHMKSCLIT